MQPISKEEGEDGGEDEKEIIASNLRLKEGNLRYRNKRTNSTGHIQFLCVWALPTCPKVVVIRVHFVCVCV